MTIGRLLNLRMKGRTSLGKGIAHALKKQLSEHYHLPKKRLTAKKRRYLRDRPTKVGKSTSDLKLNPRPEGKILQRERKKLPPKNIRTYASSFSTFVVSAGGGKDLIFQKKREGHHAKPRGGCVVGRGNLPFAGNDAPK